MLSFGKVPLEACLKSLDTVHDTIRRRSHLWGVKYIWKSSKYMRKTNEGDIRITILLSLFFFSLPTTMRWSVYHCTLEQCFAIGPEAMNSENHSLKFLKPWDKIITLPYRSVISDIQLPWQKARTYIFLYFYWVHFW